MHLIHWNYIVNVFSDQQLLITYIYMCSDLCSCTVSCHIMQTATWVGTIAYKNTVLWVLHGHIQCPPCSTVSQQYAAVELITLRNWTTCHIKVDGTRKPVSPKFDCHPKSSDTGIRLSLKIECFLDFNCEMQCIDIQIQLLSHQVEHTFRCHPNLKCNGLVRSLQSHNGCHACSLRPTTHRKKAISWKYQGSF